MRGITMAAVAAATALGLPGAIASGQETPGGTEPSYHEHLDGYFRRLTQFGFSGSVLVGSADAPEFVEAYGLADREAGRPFLPSTVVTIGSITKPFTAAAILRARELGLLELDDPISAHLPDVPADKREVTVGHLLTHTSGLKRNGLAGGDFNLEATRQAVLRDALESELATAPGESYAYSNLGYALLAMVVENASGTDYEGFLYRHILGPARMYRTGYLRPRYRDEELAIGYRGEEALEAVIRQPMLPDGPTWNLRGNGGLHSDPYDIYRWFQALRRGEVLRAATVDKMTCGRVELPEGGGSYGYGFELARTDRGTRDVSHSGGNGYFAADFHWFPDEDRMFFVAVNDASHVHMGRLSATVEAIVFGEEVALPPLIAPVPSDVLRSYAGTYTLPGGDSMTASPRDDALSVTAHGDRAIQLLLGGEWPAGDHAVDALASRSRRVVEREFAGDFIPKFEAMGGAVPVASLERYHRYDREAWDDAFGDLRGVEVVAAGTAGNETTVVIRTNFAAGAAGQVHTWRDGRLANVSVIPDWSDFDFGRTLYPVSVTEFESFEPGSPISLRIRVETDEGTGGTRLVFADHPDRPAATRPPR